MAFQISRTHMLYGIIILVAMPLALITWASNATVYMPVYGKPYIGYIVFGFGVVITLLGMGELLFRGKGLPSTLSTTIRFADVGAYSAMPHPIYTGVCIAVWGMSMAVESASGLWLITPSVVVGSIATVYGFERPFIRKTFPKSAKPARFQIPALYTTVLRYIDSLINHWRELRFGSVQIVAHGIYAGLGAMAGLLLFAFLQPTATAGLIFLLLLFTVVGSAAWGQFVEGRRGALRPFGYFGGLLGISLAMAALPSDNKFETLAALAVAIPFAQAIGRLRCLKNGCCHGHVCVEKIGIHYHTPQSTVARSGLSGIPVHPTQAYSIAINMGIGAVMLILWISSCSAANIVGAYLILTGCGQFVEEAYRGDSDAPHLFGVRLYQWLAVVLTIAGAVVTCIASSPIANTISLPHFPALVMCLLALPILWVAMGVEFEAISN